MHGSASQRPVVHHKPTSSDATGYTVARQSIFVRRSSRRIRDSDVARNKLQSHDNLATHLNCVPVVSRFCDYLLLQGCSNLSSTVRQFCRSLSFFGCFLFLSCFPPSPCRGRDSSSIHFFFVSFSVGLRWSIRVRRLALAE